MGFQAWGRVVESLPPSSCFLLDQHKSWHLYSILSEKKLPFYLLIVLNYWTMHLQKVKQFVETQKLQNLKLFSYHYLAAAVAILTYNFLNSSVLVKQSIC